MKKKGRLAVATLFTLACTLLLASCNTDKGIGSETLLTKEEAKEIVVTDLGLDLDQLSYTVVTPETMGGEEFYTVEAAIDGVTYRFRIDRASGEVVKIFVNDESVEKLPERIDATEKTDGYIGYERAKEIAFADAGTDGANVTRLEHELDFSHGKYLYEVDFVLDGVEYEYDIDAVSGEIFKKNTDKTTVKEPAVETEKYIGLDAAIDAAVAATGEAKEALTVTEAEWDREKGVSVYEIKLQSAGKKYSYVINAQSGAVIHSSVKETPAQGGTQSGNENNTENEQKNELISVTEAKKIALSHAGITDDSSVRIECELEKKHGVFFYEIDFDFGGFEYEYLISATDGEIIEADKEKDD